MNEITALILGTLAGLFSGAVTAYLTTSLRIKEERAKWDREFPMKYLEAKLNNQGQEQGIAAQFALGYLTIFPFQDFDPEEPAPISGNMLLGTPTEKVFIPQNVRLVAGRSPTNDIILKSPGVSQQHILFMADEKNVFVMDLGSRNGTYVQPVGEEQQKVEKIHKLRSGERIAVQGHQLVYSRIGDQL